MLVEAKQRKKRTGQGRLQFTHPLGNLCAVAGLKERELQMLVGLRSGTGVFK